MDVDPKEILQKKYQFLMHESNSNIDEAVQRDELVCGIMSSRVCKSRMEDEASNGQNQVILPFGRLFVGSSELNVTTGESLL
jgi:hypothetical protein